MCVHKTQPMAICYVLEPLLFARSAEHVKFRTWLGHDQPRGTSHRNQVFLRWIVSSRSCWGLQLSHHSSVWGRSLGGRTANFFMNEDLSPQIDHCVTCSRWGPGVWCFIFRTCLARFWRARARACPDRLDPTCVDVPRVWVGVLRGRWMNS